jgi:RNA polymerase subunit RPABC4/transcription elongation factor Spt4
MSIPAILVGLGMLLVTIPLIIGPLLNKKRARAPLNEPARPEGNDYQGTLMALRDLEFDHQLGIVADDDYARLQAQLMAQAARARQSKNTVVTDERIEAAVQARRRSARKQKATTIDERIEAAVQSGRATGKKQACAACHAPLKPGAKFCPRCGAAASNTCSHCRQPHEAGDKFCAACGSPLTNR